jgi:hypothetical protein
LNGMVVGADMMLLMVGLPNSGLDFRFLDMT